MKKGLKGVLCLVFAVVMIFTACVPAFAAENGAKQNKNEGIEVAIVNQLKDYYSDGETVVITARITNNSDKTRDIEVKVSPTAFMKINTINDKKLFSKTLVFKNVKPGEEKIVTVKGAAHKTEFKSKYLDINYSLFFGKYTVWLYRLNAFFKSNAAVGHFFFADSAAAVMFTANDITPEPETEIEPQADAAA